VSAADQQIADSATQASAWGRLPHIAVLRISGVDALSFLQGQVSNDTRRLAEGAPVLAAFSNAQGRVLAILHLLPHSTGVIALLPRDIVAATAERLRKFVLRAKVKVEDLSGQYGVIGAHDPAQLPAGIALAEARGYAEHDGIGIARLAPGSSRCWLVGPAPLIDSLGAPACDGPPAPRIERDWRLADIRAGLPQVYAATSEAFVAQMLNLDLIDGISFSKGCYTGQEIIARAQHLGRIKRRMFRLRLPPGTWSIGQPLKLADGRAGRLTELAGVGDEFEALAVLSLEAGTADTGTGAADTAAGPAATVAARELPLPYPLVKDR
jgi:folate-binding protein YgfZ